MAPFSRAVIPLYLNNDILNNLFAIAVQEYVEIKSVSTRDQISVHLKAPVSEFSYDLFGKYIQGDFEFQMLNEFAKQRTEEKISVVMIILKQLKDILLAQSLLKQLAEPSHIDNVQEGDYIEFNCRLRRNPVLEHVNKIITHMEIENAYYDNLGNEDTKEEKLRRAELLNFLKGGMASCKDGRCLRYIGNDLCNSNTTVVVPIKTCSLLDSEDYLLSGKVRIMGKVVKVHQNNPSPDGEEVASDLYGIGPFDNRVSLWSHTFFDHLNFEKFTSIGNNPTGNNIFSGGLVRNNLITNFDPAVLNPNGTLMEVLPIVVYI